MFQMLYIYIYITFFIYVYIRMHACMHIYIYGPVSGGPPGDGDDPYCKKMYTYVWKS